MLHGKKITWMNRIYKIVYIYPTMVPDNRYRYRNRIDDFDCDIDSDFDYTSQPILIEFFERPHFDAAVHYSDIFEPGVVEY